MARFHLNDADGELTLVDRASPKQAPLKIDFADAKLRHRIFQGGKKELLLRAVGAKPGLLVNDWTAGLGTDSLLLASAGCQVTMYERSPVMAALLSQALEDALQHDELSLIVKRMNLLCGDVRVFEANGADVIYLDPMFPHRSKSALVNGPMQYLQNLLGPDYDAEALIQFARNQPVKRVVVKRPTSAPESDATFVLKAKANRFDVYERPGAGCN